MKTVEARLANPFPGLRPFRSDEHHLFFGREEQTAALLQLLRTNRFLAVVGTSGSGKSSLVRAGMIAELHGGTMTQAGSSWEVLILRPGGSPIENLARAFVDAELYDREDPSTLPRLLATLGRSRFGLVEALKQSDLFEPGTNLLVVVDQFEELFRFRQQGVDSGETAAAFVNLLLTASEQGECPIYVTITMRSDYLGDCSEIPGLAEAVNEGEYLIPRLLRDQKRDAIEKPIGVGGAKISPLLVQRLLNDVGDDPDQLPVLQHALMRMWDVWSAGGSDGRPIEFFDFEATGGLGAALSNHADEIYDSLPDDRHRSACEKIFKTLTEKGDDNRGIRRPTRLAQLQSIAAADRDTVAAVLDAFRGSGVTFLMPGTDVNLSDRTVLDLSHESLMRGWERLRGWVEDEAQSARVFRRLLDTARLWCDGKAGLFRDPDLQIALSWREQESPNAEWAEQYGGHFDKAIGFLEASNAEAEAERHAKEAARQRELEHARELAESRKQRLIQEQRSAKRLRKLLAGLALVALIAAAACVVALIANQRAEKLAETARGNEQTAILSQKETASALATVASQKKEVEGSLSKAEAAERSARAAEEAGRKLLYTTDMRLGPFVWRDDRSTAEQLRVLLAKHIPAEKTKDEGGRMKKTADSSLMLDLSSFDLRGFEWYYYRHLLEHSATVFSHDASVADAAFAEEGQLVTLDDKGQVRRWDLRSLQEDQANRRDLSGGRGALQGILSPNGRLAALAVGNKVHVLDTASGKERYSLDYAGSGSRVRRLIFSRDSDKLVVVENKIRWCNAVSGQVIASFNENFSRVDALACSADGSLLAVVGHGNTASEFSIFRLDPVTRRVAEAAKDVPAGGSLGAAALSPDGGRLAVGAELSGAVSVFEVATLRRISEHRSAHASPCSAMAFSSDGTVLATADTQGIIKVWADVQKMNSKTVALRTLKGHEGKINAVGLSSDGKQLVSVSADKTTRVWDLETTGVAIQELERASQRVSLAARLSPDGQLIAMARGRDGVALWDAASGHLVRFLSDRDGTGARSLAFSPTNSRLLAVGYDGQAGVSHVSLWDIDAGTELARLPGATDLPTFPVDQNTGPVGALAFSPDGKYLVAGFGNRFLLTNTVMQNPLKVWEVATRRLIRHLYGHTGYCLSLAFSKDGSLLASGSRDGTAIIWSTATWRAAHTLRSQVPDEPQSTRYIRRMVENVAFSPDGKNLALGTLQGNVELWDVGAGKLVATLKGHSSGVEAVVFSPDGRTLVSGGVDNTVRLWNVETRRELMQLDPGSVDFGGIGNLGFSPDGKRLLAQGGATTAVWFAAPPIWDDPDRAVARLRFLLQSNADFPSRIRMLSENVRLHEALAKLDTKDVRVRAALAATQANWHASRQAWPEAVQAFDRLVAADPTAPDAWLRTPVLLRLATALLQQNRPRDAAALLKGGAQRREQDGLSVAVDEAGLGIDCSTADGSARITGLVYGSPASRSHLLVGDVIVKVNDTELMDESFDNLVELLAGEAGTKIQLTVRHPGKEMPEVIELTRERFVNDAATGELLHTLRAAIDSRLATEPRNPEFLELRAELAGQWSDTKAQLTDYTAAIDALSQQNGEVTTGALKRLYGRRGNAYVALKQWEQAVGDYGRAATDATTDDALLSNQALARANLILERESAASWTVLKPTKMKSEGGATLGLRQDDSILASGTNPNKDVYIIDAEVQGPVGAIRLEAIPDPSMPVGGSGRAGSGNFVLTDFRVVAGEGVVAWSRAHADFSQEMDGMQPKRFPIEFAIDKDESTGWAIWPRVAEPHWAMFIPSQPITSTGKTQLTIRLAFRSPYRQNTLGHFRLSISGDPPSLEREQQRFAAMKLTDPWQKLAAAFQLQEDQRAIDQLVERRPNSARVIGDLFTQEPNQSWQRAIEIYNKGIKGDTTDVELLAKRARAYEAMKNWDAAAADWSQVANGNPEGSKLLAEFARRLAAAGELPLANGQFEKSQALYERLLQADPECDPVAAERAAGDAEFQTELARHFAAQGNARAAVAARAKARALFAEKVAPLAKASAANPEDTTLSLSVAALQAWFGQEKELAATRQRILALAKGTRDMLMAERAAKVCSLVPSTDEAEHEAGLALARTAVEVGEGGAWNLLTLGMAEYRSRHDAAAAETLRAAMTGPTNYFVRGTAAFYRAMSLYRLGKPDEARKLAIAAAAKMKPLPNDEASPLASNVTHDDLILWLAYKEAKAMIQFDATAPSKVGSDQK